MSGDTEIDPIDRLAEEFAERCRAGESPSVAEYESRHPEQAPRIRKLLSTVAMMEQLKRGPQRARAAGPARKAPERLGEFRVLRELGRGGMGVVYEAVQESLGRHVAVKVIHHMQLDARKLERFRRETQAIGQLHHTNIVPIFGVGEDEGVPYYVMPYIGGHGLDILLASWRAGKPPSDDERWRLVAGLCAQAALALQHAHDQGVLHRDIKPANLIVDEHHSVWITDFGLAKLVGHEDLTATGDVVGTLRYLAPETLGGRSDPRSDVYSLGLTLYELLTLTPPFGEVSASELLRQVSQEQPIAPRRLDPAIPRDLETIVLKATAREPGDRYPTAGALAADLQCFLDDRPIQARRSTALERAWRWSRRNKITAALAATAASALVLAAVVGWAGYVSTTRALGVALERRKQAEDAGHRAEENVALSLEVFGELFDKLAGQDTIMAPPTGRRRPSVLRRLAPPPDAARNSLGPDRRAAGEFGGPLGRPSPEANTALLQSILTFYERFARKNATNSRLHVEAAWAYRKVAALYTRLGRQDDAERALSRAIEMLEERVAEHPELSEYRTKLVETYIMVDPWAASPTALLPLEQRLSRALELANGLAAESPGNPAYREAQIHAHAKLGTVLERRGRAGESEASYRRALACEETLIQSSPASERPRFDRVDTREALALLILERGRAAEAAALLRAAAADLEDLALLRPSPPLADRFDSLAAGFQRLGDTTRAQELSRRAAELRSRPGMAPPYDPSREPGQPGAPKQSPAPRVSRPSSA